LSQAANTFLINKVKPSARSKALAHRKTRIHWLVDGIIMAVILAASGLCVSVYLRSRGEVYGAMNKHEVATERVEALSLQVEKLEREVKQLQSDPRAIEAYARWRFGLVRPGDAICKMTEEQTSATMSRPVQVANLTPSSTGGYTVASH
jgi:cell division protein FtsB